MVANADLSLFENKTFSPFFGHLSSLMLFGRDSLFTFLMLFCLALCADSNATPKLGALSQEAIMVLLVLF